jgi:hypothetical protein
MQVDVQSNRKDIEDRLRDISGHIQGNHEKKMKLEMEDNPEWILAPRIRYLPKKTRCRDGRKGYEDLRAKGSIMERSASPGYQCIRILHLIETLLGGTSVWVRIRYNLNNCKHFHTFLGLSSHDSYNSNIRFVKGRHREWIQKGVSS